MGESEAGYDAMIQWIQARIELPGYASELWLGEHDEVARSSSSRTRARSACSR